MAYGFWYTGKVRKSVTIVTSNSKVQEYHGLYIGTAGHVAVVEPTNLTTTSIYKNVAVGFQPIVTYKILTTSTTASNIRGLILGR